MRPPGRYINANLRLGWYGPTRYIPANLGVDPDGPEPPDPPEPAYRGVRSRIVGIGWAQRKRGDVRAVVRMPWRQPVRVARSVDVAWASLLRATVRAGVAMPWGDTAGVRAASRGIVWGQGGGNVRDTRGIAWVFPPIVRPRGAGIVWRVRADRVANAVEVPWYPTETLRPETRIVWRDGADRVAVEANMPFLYAIRRDRQWRIPWGQSDGLPWHVGPRPEPPEPEPPQGRIPGRYVGANLGCPVWTGSSRYIPANLGIAACYNVRRRRRVYVVRNEVTVVRLPDNEPVQVTSIDITLDVGSPMNTLSMALASEADLSIVRPGSGGPREVLVTINGHALTFIVEDWSIDRRFAQHRYTVTGRSRTALLAAPYAPPRTRTQTTISTGPGLADFELLDTGYTLAWDSIDWTVPAGAWSYSERTPLDVIVDIAAGAGAVVQSDPVDKTVHVRPRYPVRPWLWTETAPDVELSSDIAVQITEALNVKPKYNEVYVAATAIGVQGWHSRTGEGGGVEAPQFTHPLVNTSAVHLEVGSNILSDRGRQSDWTFSGVPLWPEPLLPGQVGLLLPLQLALVYEGGGSWMGLITRNQIAVKRDGKALTVTQSVNIERHPEDAN